MLNRLLRFKNHVHSHHHCFVQFHSLVMFVSDYNHKICVEFI